MKQIYPYFLALFFFGAVFNADSKPPNIIFLLADDQATISMGCYGNKDALTPNLDQLSAKGVTFDRHYDTTAICWPAGPRYSPVSMSMRTDVISRRVS